MTKILKRPLSILLAVLMVMSVFIAVPMTARADDSAASLTIGENVTYYDSFDAAVAAVNAATSDCTLTVLKTVDEGKSAAFTNTGDIKITLSVPSGVTLSLKNPNANNNTGQYPMKIEGCKNFHINGEGTIHLKGSLSFRSLWITSGSVVTIEDGIHFIFEANANNDNTWIRCIWVENSKLDILGGDYTAKNNSIRNMSMVVSAFSGTVVNIYGGHIGWNPKDQSKAGTLDAAANGKINVYGGYIDGVLWVQNGTPLLEAYSLYGGKFYGDAVARVEYDNSQHFNLKTISEIVGDKLKVKSISENPYFAEVVSAKCKAISSDENAGTATVDGVAEKNEYFGTEVTFVATPKIGYSFVEWKRGEAVVSTDATYKYTPSKTTAEDEEIELTATFKAVPVVTVTWKNGDTTLETDTVSEGTTPEYNGAKPKKETADGTAYYPFLGWSPEVETATADTTYTAVFSDTAVPYHIHDGIVFKEWTNTDSLPKDAGNYYLTSDVTTSATWTVPAGEMNLCLNGHKIDANGGNYAVITIGNGCTLNLYDPEGGGVITGANHTAEAGGVMVSNGGHFNMYGGSIEGNRSTNGGGVSANGSNAVFHMYGGSIQYNEGYDNTGGILLGHTTFTMSGGSIQHNAGKNYGGIGAAYATMIFDGDVNISDNYIYSGGTSGKIAKSGDTYTLDTTGGTPCNVKTAIANDRIQVTGQLTLTHKIGIIRQGTKGVFTTGYTTSGNTADPREYFYSDNPNYTVGLSNGEAAIVDQCTVTWNNWNGDELEKDTRAAIGATPTYNGDTPTKAADTDYYYTFAGWDVTPAAITGNTTYTATFTAVPKRINYGGDNYIKKDDKVAVSASDTGAEKFGLNLPQYLNMQMLGIQKKSAIATQGGDDGIRFVTVVNSNLLKGSNIEDYGYIVVKAKEGTSAADIYSKMDNLTYDKVANSPKNFFTCKGSSNTISGEFGKYASNTDYKYVTLSLTGTSSSTDTIAARFYVKTKDDKFYYADYIDGNDVTHGGMAFTLPIESDILV